MPGENEVPCPFEAMRGGCPQHLERCGYPLPPDLLPDEDAPHDVVFHTNSIITTLTIMRWERRVRYARVVLLAALFVWGALVLRNFATANGGFAGAVTNYVTAMRGAAYDTRTMLRDILP